MVVPQPAGIIQFYRLIQQPDFKKKKGGIKTGYQLNPKKPSGLFCPPGRPRQGCTGQALKLNDLAFLFKVRIPESFNVGVNPDTGVWHLLDIDA